MKYLPLILTLTILLLTSVSAQDDFIQKFKIGQAGTIFVNCANSSGQQCSASATGNLTMRYANGSLWLDNVGMIRNNFQFIYNFSGSKTLTQGDYFGSALITDGGISTIIPIQVQVTPSGDSRGISFTIMLLLAGTIILLLGFVFKNPMFGAIAGIITMVGGVYTIIYGFNNIRDLYTQSLGMVGTGMGIILLTLSAYEWLDYKGETTED